MYDITYKTLIGSKPLCIRFDKKDRIIKIYDGTRYLTLFGTKNMTIYDRIYHISTKRSITYIFSDYSVKIKVDFYDSLSIDKILTLHNVIILLKTVLNTDKNHCYYKIFLERCLYQLAKKY